MALPYSFIGAGTYTNGASLVPVNVALSDSPDWFFVKDISNWGRQSGGKSVAAAPIYAEWFSSMALGSALLLNQENITAGSANLDSLQVTSGGFTFINPSSPPAFTPLAATAIDKTTLVVSMASTAGLSIGDTVRITNTTAMLQIGGIVAQITAITPNVSITLGYIATAVGAGLNLNANATNASVSKIYLPAFYPRLRQIMYITQATQAKVYFSRPNDYTVGELVDFTIPSQYGMIQLSYLTALPGGAAQVLAVTNSASESSITINVNTTGYTAFQYPTSAGIQTGGVSPATCYPAGSGVVPGALPPQTNLQDAFDNRQQYYMQIGTSACGIASATMQWVAMKADYGTLSNA